MSAASGIPPLSEMEKERMRELFAFCVRQGAKALPIERLFIRLCAHARADLDIAEHEFKNAPESPHTRYHPDPAAQTGSLFPGVR